MKVDVIDIVNLVRSSDWFKGGEHIEIAKGKNQLVTTWKEFKRKLKRELR
jgi:hypothetical protein